MARSTDINQRIVLTGDDEVRRKLDALGAAGTRAFDRAGGSGKQLGFAVRNLGFQVNDLVTSFASGAPVMQVFAQQGGQIVQAFQEGGGLSAVLGGVTSRLKSMITPMRVVGGLAVTAGAGFGALLLRAQDSESAIRQFKVTLDALKPPAFAGGDILKNAGVTPEKLDESAKRLRSAGLTLAEGRKEILEAIQGGIPPKLAEDVVRFGKDLDAAFGEKGKKSAEAFKKAIEGGAPALRKFGEDIGLINPRVSELQDGLRDVPSLLRAIIMNAPNIKGAADRILGPFDKLMRDFKVQLGESLDALTVFSQQGILKLDAFQNWIATTSEGLGIPAAFRAGFTGASEAITAGLENLKKAFSPEVFTAAWLDTAKLVAPFKIAGDAIIQTLTEAFSSADPFAPLVGFAQSAVTTISSWLKSLADYAAGIARTIASLGSSSMPEFTAAILPAFVPDLTGSGGFAAGGLVRGPGSGTSDSVPAWLSQGEFVMRTAAVRHWGTDFLSALNGLNAPLVPRSRGFAAGGLVGAAAAGGGGTVVLNLDGQSFETHAQQDVFESLKKVAGRKQLLSAGRRQSWMGGRRYGG